MPEIREQAYDVARSVVRGLHGETRRRPSDVYGLTLTTGRRAADAYNEALGRLLRLQDGVEEGLEQATALDPGFAQAHAALALLGHEWGAAGSWRSVAERGARRCRGPRTSTTARSASWTRSRSGSDPTSPPVPPPCSDTSGCSPGTPSPSAWPCRPSRSAASPPAARPPTWSRAWAGATATTGGTPASWRSCARTRSAGSEAESLASYALSVEPSSGHAVHARAHVFYETGQHAAGLAWLDEWIRTRGPEANHRSHFSWHAALHELMQCDIDAVRRRYERELAPPLVSGSRALVDSGALLWRLHVTDTWEGELPARGRPRLGAGRLADHSPDGVRRPALGAHPGRGVRRGRPGGAADDVAGPRRPDVPRRRRTGVLRVAVGGRRRVRLRRHAADPSPSHGPTALGGSAAQRDVLQDTLVYALARSGQGEQAAAVLDERLSRRASPLDARQRARIKGGRYREAGSGKTGVLLRQERHQHPLGHQVGERSPGPVCQTGDDHEGPLLHALDRRLRHIGRRRPT